VNLLCRIQNEEPPLADCLRRRLEFSGHLFDMQWQSLHWSLDAECGGEAPERDAVAGAVAGSVTAAAATIGSSGNVGRAAQRRAEAAALPSLTMVAHEPGVRVACCIPGFQDLICRIAATVSVLVLMVLMALRSTLWPDRRDGVTDLSVVLCRAVGWLLPPTL